MHSKTNKSWVVKKTVKDVITGLEFLWDLPLWSLVGQQDEKANQWRRVYVRTYITENILKFIDVEKLSLLFWDSEQDQPVQQVIFSLVFQLLVREKRVTRNDKSRGTKTVGWRFFLLPYPVLLIWVFDIVFMFSEVKNVVDHDSGYI